MSFALVFAIVIIVVAIGFLIAAFKGESKVASSHPSPLSAFSTPSETKLQEEPVSLKISFNKPGANKRVCAYLIDLAAVFILLWGVRLVFKVDANWWFMTVYWLLRDSLNGQSMGKFFVGLQVVNEAGKAITPLEGIIRNIPLVIPFVNIIEYIVMLNDTQGRRLGDKMAQTKVYDLKPQVADGVFLLVSLFVVAICGFFYIKFIQPEVKPGKRFIAKHKTEPSSTMEVPPKYFVNKISNSSSDTIETLFQKGFQAVRSKNFQEAKQYFQEALKFDPQELGAYANLAFCDFYLQDYASAIELYDKAVQMGYPPHLEWERTLKSYRVRSFQLKNPITGELITFVGNTICADVLITDVLPKLSVYVEASGKKFSAEIKTKFLEWREMGTTSIWLEEWSVNDTVYSVQFISKPDGSATFAIQEKIEN